MCEFLVRRSDNRIIRCEGDGFAWGSMESKAEFNRFNPHKTYPGKLALIRVPGVSKAVGDALVDSTFYDIALSETDRSALSVHFEITLEEWQFRLATNG